MLVCQIAFAGRGTVLAQGEFTLVPQQVPLFFAISVVLGGITDCCLKGVALQLTVRAEDAEVAELIASSIG